MQKVIYLINHKYADMFENANVIEFARHAILLIDNDDADAFMMYKIVGGWNTDHKIDTVKSMLHQLSAYASKNNAIFCREIIKVVEDARMYEALDILCGASGTPSALLEQLCISKMDVSFYINYLMSRSKEDRVIMLKEMSRNKIATPIRLLGIAERLEILNHYETVSLVSRMVSKWGVDHCGEVVKKYLSHHGVEFS